VRNASNAFNWPSEEWRKQVRGPDGKGINRIDIIPAEDIVILDKKNAPHQGWVGRTHLDIDI
jgi:hypothetical protein